MILDLSYPDGGSVNDHTAPDNTIPMRYDGAQAMAQRALQVEHEFPGRAAMLSGDLNGAFKHIPVHADHVGMFAGTIPELGILVIDLACPFGWTDSPGHYWVAGEGINHLHVSGRLLWPLQPVGGRDQFDGKAWCDDHNCIEPDVGSRLAEAEISLRTAMIQVLGPDACNDDKFTSWFRRGTSLGLVWDLEQQLLSLPDDKIAKATGRVRAMFAVAWTTRSQLNQLLGSLRHVATCVRAATPFFQRLAALSRRSGRHARVAITASARDDLRWFLLILQHAGLNQVSFTRFTNSTAPSVAIFMDASDLGLCALNPARKEYLQVRFDAAELRQIATFKAGASSEFGINPRELMSAVFASLVWGRPVVCAVTARALLDRQLHRRGVEQPTRDPQHLCPDVAARHGVARGPTQLLHVRCAHPRGRERDGGRRQQSVAIVDDGGELR